MQLKVYYSSGPKKTGVKYLITFQSNSSSNRTLWELYLLISLRCRLVQHLDIQQSNPKPNSVRQIVSEISFAKVETITCSYIFPKQDTDILNVKNRIFCSW